MKTLSESLPSRHLPPSAPPDGVAPGIPAYLQQLYWWAYVHPNAVRVFEREWLINLILWGNFRRLRDAALAEFGEHIEQQLLQLACVYGDFTPCIAARLRGAGALDVVDVLPIQLANLRRKLPADLAVRLHHQDAAALDFAAARFDASLLFFLLHEQPEAVRRATLAEALRVTRPGGKLVIVDYHRPAALHPLRHPMRLVLGMLEPFALDLWRHELADYLPAGFAPAAVSKSTFFGGLYQKVVITL